MKFSRLIGMLVVLISVIFAQNSYMVYFNEVRSDDDGTDDIQFIELIGPAGTDISGLMISHYNGSDSQDGEIWSHTIGGFTIPDDCLIGVGFYVLGEAGVTNVDETIPGDLQNGPDGLVLFNTDGTTILDAIAWEGAGDMTADDPGTVTTAGPATANNYLHVLPDDDATDNSISAPNQVDHDTGSGWIVIAATPGLINGNQICNDVSLPVELSYFSIKETIMGVQLKWQTESEFENIGFLIERKTEDIPWSEIVSYKTDDALIGQGTTSNPRDYEYIDRFIEKGKKYYYRLADVDQNGSITYHEAESIIVKANPLSAVPDRLSLTTYPNPFNPTVNILYYVPDNNSTVKIDIINIHGEFVANILNKNQLPGWHQLQWSGLDNDGNIVPGGTYFCQIKAGNEIRNNKLVYLK